MLRSALVFFIILVVAGAYAISSPAQNKPWAGFGIEVNPIAGRVFKHEAKFTLPIPALSTGIDINLLQRTYGKKPWQQARKYPTIGIGVTYINYGIDSVYGQCIGLYPNITLPLITGKKLQWTLRVGDGIAYVSNQFRRTKQVNTTNVAIGSRINDFAMFATDLRYRVNHHWDLQLGGNVTHISNASYRKPNLGVNMMGAHLGLTYFPVTSQPDRIMRKMAPIPSRWLIQGRLSFAYISSFTPGGPLYPVYLGSAYASRRWKGKNKAFAGLDLAYYSSIYAWQRNNEINVGHERANAYKSAVFVGNEFLLGRVGVVFQLGCYLQESAMKADRLYQKVGGQYYIVQREKGPLKELFLSAFLKTHKTVAELGELGVGFGF